MDRWERKERVDKLAESWSNAIENPTELKMFQFMLKMTEFLKDATQESMPPQVEPKQCFGCMPHRKGRVWHVKNGFRDCNCSCNH